MKKLLLGALLIVGATAYGAVSVELKEDSPGGAGTYSGKGTLGLTSRGEVVDASGKVMLIITPTVSAGADGTSLSFDHGQIPVGTSSELTGKFEAKVVTGAKNEIVPVTDSQLTVKLYAGTESVDKGKYSTGTKLVVGNGTQAEASDAKLYYQLTNDSTVQGNIYRGTVLSKVDAGKTAGTFLDRSGKIEVTVERVEAKVTPAP